MKRYRKPNRIYELGSIPQVRWNGIMKQIRKLYEQKIPFVFSYE